MTENTIETGAPSATPAHKPTFNQRKELFFEEHPWIPSILKLITYLGYTLVALLVALTVFMKMAHISPMSVVSNSMVPTFEKGDLILVSNHYNALSVGDVVVYHQEIMHRDVVHRIISITGNEIQVQGDANPSPDPVFNRSAVKGEVMGIIPNMAYLFMRPVIFSVVSLSVLLGFLTDGWSMRFRKRSLSRHEPAYFAAIAKEEKDNA